MKPTKNFLILFILVLVLVIIGVEMLTQPKLRYLFSKPTSYAQCVDAGGAILESYPSQCSFRGQTFVNPDEKVDVSSGLETYEDRANSYSFQYPGDIFTLRDTNPIVPFVDKTSPFPSKQLIHQIDVEHCDLSGLPEGCTPTTTDISITFTPINKDFGEVVSAGQDEYDLEIQDVTFGSNTFKTSTLGAEGEGLFYYFMALPNNRTLLITRTYINEEMLLNYQKEPEFIKFAQQAEIFNQIAQTISTTTSSSASSSNATSSSGSSLAQLAGDTSGWETFTNNTRGYSIKYPNNWVVEPVNRDSSELVNGPVRYLKFTSPDKKYLLTVGIKRTNEDVALAEREVHEAGDLVKRGELIVAATTFPIEALTSQNDVHAIFYYSGGVGTTNITIRDYDIHAEFNRIAGSTSLDQAPELAIANSILSSLTLTK